MFKFQLTKLAAALAGVKAPVVSSFLPIGTSGGTSPSDYGFPPYQNGMRTARGFMTIANANNFTTRDTNGWPTTDFQTYLIEVQNYSPLPSWAHISDSANPWKCGYTSKNGGAETIAGISATISNVVNTAGVVTFNLVPTGGAAGFSITGTTGGVTNVFCNLPEYPTASGTFTTQFINLLKNFGMQRSLDWSNALWNDLTTSWATRNTAANTHSKMWNPSNLASTITNGTGEGAPVDDFVALCNATNADIWYNLPLKDDGTYVTGLASYLFANLNSNLNVRIEFVNELWNGVGVGGGTYSQWVCAFILANPGVLDWDIPLTFAATANGTTTITCTPPSGTSAGWSITGPGVPAGTTITTVNSTSLVLSNAVTTGSGTFATVSYAALYRYYGKRMYDAYVAFSAAFSSQYASRVKLVLAWQQGGLSAFTNMIGFLQHYHSGIPVGTMLGSLSVAPYETRDNTSVPGDGVNHVNVAATAATIEAQLTANGNYRAFLGYSENIAILAMHYGMDLEAYECGWESGGETAASNYGLAIMDSGMTAVVSSYLQNLLNSGYSRLNWTAFGISNNNTPASDPGYALSSNYSTLISTGSPRLAGIQAVNTSGVAYTRNVVGTGTFTIDAINYADNVSAMSATYPYLGQLNSYAQGPYYSYGGYIGYIINCTKAGNYAVTATFNATTTGTTSCECGSSGNAGLNNIATGKSIPIGTGVSVAMGTFALALGANYILLGNGTTYAGIVPKSLIFVSQ